VRVWIAEISGADDWGAEAKKEQKARDLGITGSASALEWSPRGDLVAVTLAPTPSVDDAYMNQSIHIMDPSNGEAKGLYQPPGKMGAYAWSPDGKHLAVISSADRNDPAAGRLVVVPVAGGEAKDVLPQLEGHVTDLVWKDGETVLYVAAVGTSSVLGEIGYDGQRSRVFIPAAKGLLLNSVEKARNNSAIAFLSDSLSHPAEVFLAPSAEGALRRLTNSNPWLADLRFARQEAISYTARDGLQIEGVLVRPLDEQSGRRYPLIVAVHGGPEAHVANSWVTSYANPGQVAAARGMAVFYPNYRGSTGRGVEFSKLDHGDPAGKEFDDIVDGVDHLVASGLVDKDKVGITGGSYGGYASAWGATYYTERFAASVMFVGISDAVSPPLRDASNTCSNPSTTPPPRRARPSA
jgi:dipeptidyl aminopeptidase/acylaminoacyl peptidase